MIKPLKEGLKKKYNDHKFLLSFISPSGYENINKKLFDCVANIKIERNSPSICREKTVHAHETLFETIETHEKQH